MARGYGQDEMPGGSGMRYWGFWMLMRGLLQGQVKETVKHDPTSQLLIPIGRAILGGFGVSITIIAYIALSYLWAWNISLNDMGRAALPALVFGIPGIYAALLGMIRGVQGAYWGSRQSMYLVYGIASGALCYVFIGIAVADPNGVLFWELAKTAGLIGGGTFGFLSAIWGVLEQLIVYQMTEAQRGALSVLMPRMGQVMDSEDGNGVMGVCEKVVREWTITLRIHGNHVKIFRFDPAKLEESKFAFWAETVIAMGRGREDVSYPYWVRGKRMRRGEYDHLTEVLVARGAMEKEGRASNSKLYLTKAGRPLIRAWLAAYVDYEMTAEECPEDEEEVHHGTFDYDDGDITADGEYSLEERFDD